MRCPFCKTRISKNDDFCPNCEKSKYEISKESSNVFSKKVTNITFSGILIFCILLSLFGFYILYSYPRSHTERTYTSYENVLNRYSDIWKVENIRPLIEYRDNLKCILDRLEYQNIQVVEEVKINDLMLENATLTISASLNDMQIKMTLTADKSNDINKSFSVAGSGFSAERHFEIEEDNIEDIFNYLEFDEGYQLLVGGYQKMTKVEEDKYKYANNDVYNVMMSNDIYGSIYKYSYMMSK